MTWGRELSWFAHSPLSAAAWTASTTPDVALRVQLPMLADDGEHPLAVWAPFVPDTVKQHAARVLTCMVRFGEALQVLQSVVELVLVLVVYVVALWDWAVDLFPNPTMQPYAPPIAMYLVVPLGRDVALTPRTGPWSFLRVHFAPRRPPAWSTPATPVEVARSTHTFAPNRHIQRLLPLGKWCKL